MRFAVIDFDVSGGPAVSDYVPIGVVVEVGSTVEFRYTQEAMDASHPRYIGMAGRLGELKAQADSGSVVVDWHYVLARLVEESYLGLKFRVGVPIDEEMSTDEVFEKYVVRREVPEDISVTDDRVPSAYFGTEIQRVI